MPVTRTRMGRLGRTVAKKSRKRASVATRAKFQRPTAKNQQRQILANARQIAKVSKVVLSNRVWCDFQYSRRFSAAWDIDGNFTETWGAYYLTDFANWSSVLRKDTNALESAKTWVDRLQINMSMSLNNANYAQFNCFVVYVRKDNTGTDIVGSINAGATPVVGSDYISDQDGFRIRLNSAQFKVAYSSYQTLTEAGLFESISGSRNAGNPYSTWRKAQLNLPIKQTYRTPLGTGATWLDVSPMSQAYYKRPILLVKIVAQNSAGADVGGARFSFDSLATTINMM